ncbi:MAG: outer membrane protein assembly factor BamB family protein [Limisphaerales bacterium]
MTQVNGNSLDLRSNSMVILSRASALLLGILFGAISVDAGPEPLISPPDAIVINGESRCESASGKKEANSPAARWPQFRGENASGVAEGTFPTFFGPESNVVWKVKIPSGHSSPCVWDDRLFLTGFADSKLEVICLDRSSGREIWKRQLEPGQIERGSHLSHPATATPVTDGKAVYIYFASLGLLVCDLNGTELWRKPLPIPITQHGPGTSPVLAGGKLILACDQDTESYLLCVDSHTGDTLWRTERPGFKRSFATPLIFPEPNSKEVIVAGSLRLVSYSLHDGSELWSASGLPNEMVSSPIVGNGLIFAAGWTHGSGVRVMPTFNTLLAKDADANGRLSRNEAPTGPVKQHFVYLDANKDGELSRPEYEATASLFDKSQNAVIAVRPKGRGDITERSVLWKQTRGMPYCPTPLFHDGKLYMVKNGGLLSCLDARTGEVFYEVERIGALGDYYSSPVAADGKICLISHAGTAVVVKAGPKFEVLARNELKEPVLATPAIVANQLIVRTATHLYNFEAQEKIEFTLVQ